MRRFDKKINIEKANILAEERFLKSKNIISESFKSPDSDIENSNPIEEIGGFTKRSAFNKTMDKYDKTPEWDLMSKNKYAGQVETAMSHVSPKVKETINKIGERFKLNVFFKKHVGGPDNIPVFDLYFNTKDNRVSRDNYLFMYNITPMEYRYLTFNGQHIARDEAFDRAMARLIPYIQSNELNFHSNLK